LFLEDEFQFLEDHRGISPLAIPHSRVGGSERLSQNHTLQSLNARDPLLYETSRASYWRVGMSKPKTTGSAALHLRMGAFVTVFMALVVFFSPLEAVLLTLGSSVVLSKL
jgi:hypothetical protein